MRYRAYLPLFVFLALALALWIGLYLKPSEVPSVLVGKAVPEFVLPALYDDGGGLSADTLRQPGIKVVNVWASWCAPCRVEHPQLMALSRLPGITVYGINYKDRPAAAQQFLDKLGNPFAAVGADNNGRASIEWGVYGVPETFVINGAGEIVYRHVGVISGYDLAEKFLPLIRRLGAAS